MVNKNSALIAGRELDREEIEQVWRIDRSEAIERVYYFENGALVCKPEHYAVRGWPPGEAEKYTPLLADCFERGGWFYGLFEDGALVGAAILDSKRIGQNKDALQLKFLHVSRAYRNKGLGRHLFDLAKVKASEKGARRLYISATPSENTIDFYRRLGCMLARELDPELYALEPEDIHLECEV
jgi:predicted N-acetyltransferase YhbS